MYRISYIFPAMENGTADSHSISTPASADASFTGPLPSQPAQRVVYIYTLAHPLTGEVRYVGKTKTNLSHRLRSHLDDKSITYKVAWLKSLAKQGLKPVIEVLEATCEDEWVEQEAFWIQNLRFLGCKLTNLTKGGDGGSTYKELRIAANKKAWATRRARGKGRMSDAFRKKMSDINKGNQNHKGHKHSLEMKQRMSIIKKGFRHTAECLNRMSEIQRANWVKRKEKILKGLLISKKRKLTEQEKLQFRLKLRRAIRARKLREIKHISLS